MSEKKDKKQENKHVNNIVAFPPASVHCVACSKKKVKAQFCEEHFLWFKEGLIDKKGHKPKDFQQKHALYLKKQAKVA